MRKTSARKAEKKPMPLFTIIILMLVLTALISYIVGHINDASMNGERVKNTEGFQTQYPAASDLPVPTVPLEISSPSDAEASPATPVAPVSTEKLVAPIEDETIASAGPGTPVEVIYVLATSVEPETATPCEEEKKELLQVYFMSVGRNDGILIRMGDECAFIDGGQGRNARKAFEYISSNELGIKKLKYYIATHGHEDHVGCGGLVLKTFDTETILYNSDLSIQTMLESAKNGEVRDLINRTEKKLFLLNDTVMIGDAVLTCVGPEKVVPRKDKMDGTENENSMIIRLTYGNHSFLLTGDATSKNFFELMNAHPEYTVCDVIKGAHHDSPINKDFLKASKAKYYVYSTGDEALPPEWDINQVREMGARVFITSKNNAGTTLFTTDGEHLNVITENTAPNWKLDHEKIRLKVGKVARCNYNPGKSTMDTLHWTASDENIVKIEYGFDRVKIYALAPGKCTVTATHFDGSTREIAVEVIQ